MNKEYGLFGTYEGLRIAEIQSSNVFEGGQWKGWALVAGTDNPADWCTKPRTAKDIGNPFFYKGAFLEKDEKDWPIKWTFKTGKLEGEIEKKSTFCNYASKTFPDVIGKLVERSSLWEKMIRVLAWILRIGVPPGPLSNEEVSSFKLYFY